jgi:cytidylate kinase
MDLYNGEIISAIARSTHVNESMVRTLDEKGATFVNDLFAEMIGQYGLTSDEYFNALVKTIATIAWHGNSVIVGRGAAYILRNPKDLRVRFLAPLDTRIDNTMRELAITREAARHRVLKTDADYRHFTHHYFRIDFDDLGAYDLAINNRTMDLASSVEVVKATLKILANRS